MDLFFTITLWLAAIGCGVMAGVYFAFSAFVMKALAEIPATNGVAAMQSINKVIVSSAFLPLFFGSSFLCFALLAVAPFIWQSPTAIPAAAAGLIYLAGMLGCTVVFNVPLNNKLAAVDACTREAAVFWHSYLQHWTRWNHVRTLASTTACVLFIYAISLN